MRRSIRPVTLRRAIEVASIAVNTEKIDKITVKNALKTSERRAKELVLELQRMKLLKNYELAYKATPIAHKIINAYENEDWKELHNILHENYDFYKIFINALSNETLTRDEILTKLSHNKELTFNNTSIHMLCDWAERLGQVQRNLYTNRYYLLENKGFEIDSFIEVMECCYESLNKSIKPGIQLTYVEIAHLRENVCEQMRINRDVFDESLKTVFQMFIGKMELCGAPLTTSAKRSPSSIRMMKKGENHPILSPSFTTIQEGKGLELKGKLYHYLAIFNSLKGGN